MEKLVLKVVFLFLLLGFLAPVSAQDKISLEGVWLLDSIQVKETTLHGTIDKTIFPTKERKALDALWMSQFSVKGDSLSYLGLYGNSFDNNSYTVEIKNGKNVFIVNGVPDIKMYTLEMSSSDHLQLFHSFSGSRELESIDVSWTFYYSKN